jgi:hypothetical protein
MEVPKFICCFVPKNEMVTDVYLKSMCMLKMGSRILDRRGVEKGMF